MPERARMVIASQRSGEACSEVFRRDSREAHPTDPGKERASEVHRHKETVDPGLAPAAIVPVEDPVVSILARQRLADGDATDVTVDRVIVVGCPMDLVRAKMM